MKIRRARSSDLPAIRDLARSLGLDYPGMEDDLFWVAARGSAIVGIAALKRHADCLELVSLGVEPGSRERGLGQRLVQALLDAAPADVFLATIIPAFFARTGFVPASSPPAGLAKDPAWCEGCPKDRCVIMVKAAS